MATSVHDQPQRSIHCFQLCHFGLSLVERIFFHIRFLRHMGAVKSHPYTLKNTFDILEDRKCMQACGVLVPTLFFLWKGVPNLPT
jgi:hypothetical protein